MGMYRGPIVAVLVGVVLSFSVSTSACPDKSYIGLYADGIHSDCSQDVVAYQPFTVWVWIKPSVRAVQSVEFRLEKPPWLDHIGTIQNCMTVTNPVPYDWFGDGGRVFFKYCQYQWTWLFRFEMMPTMGGITGYISIHEWLVTGELKVQTCNSDEYLVQPLTPLTFLALNMPCETGAESCSWGAIKALYKQ